MNYLQKCNISCHFFKTALHCRVKHKSLKMLQLLISIADRWWQRCAKLLW